MARVLSPQEVAAMIVASRRDDDQPRFARRKVTTPKPQAKPEPKRSATPGSKH